MRGRLAIVPVAAISLLILISWVVWMRLNPSLVQQALDVMNEQERFRTATESGVAFARAASLLKQAGEQCESAREPTPRCEALFTAAATAQVQAASVLRCTRPGIFDARRRMIVYLEALEDERNPAPPGLPNCE